MNLEYIWKAYFMRGHSSTRYSELVKVNYIIQEGRIQRVAQKKSGYSTEHGIGGCRSSTYGTAAVVRWEIAGGRFEDNKRRENK